MKTLREVIEDGVRQALVAVMGPEGAEVDPVVRPTQDAKFGDYQSNVALSLAKRLGKQPRQVASEIVAALPLAEVCDAPEIAGPGFINFRLRPAYVADRLAAIQADPRLGIAPTDQPQRVIVDFSSPNLAKEMHVGHLRSTIIGDAIARLLEFNGHDVVRLNHVGDWGTQFGMLLQYVRETQPDVIEHPERFRLDNLETFYIAAKRRFDENAAFADSARRAVVELQSGEPAARKVWEVFCSESLRHAHEIYRRLDIRVEDRGESFYNPLLPGVVSALQEKGTAVESQGAIVVFLEQWKSKEGTPFPVIIRKSDGGYMYATTDLGGIQYRTREDRADRIIYVTDKRQADHFQQVFTIARNAGWVPEGVSLEHVGFGMVLGENRKPFATRTGGTVKLRDVLDEAQTRSLAAIEASDESDRRTAFSDDQKREIARAVGLGGVKYFDLSHNAESDYVFDWDTMLALNGNTAPYMLYAYARVRSIGRKAGVDFTTLPSDLPLVLEHESEIALAKQLLLFSGVLAQVSRELRPHVLTDYLYSLSRAYSTFYDREHGVRVIDAEPENVRLSRLRLCDLTARTLQQGLSLLGISVVEEM